MGDLQPLGDDKIWQLLWDLNAGLPDHHGHTLNTQPQFILGLGGIWSRAVGDDRGGCLRVWLMRDVGGVM